MTIERNYALLVFDWDGTLADSEAIIVQAMQRAIRMTCMPGREAADIRNVIGLGLAEAVSRLYPQATNAELQALATAYRDAWLAATTQPVPLFPAARDTLRFLQSRGYLLAVATGKSRSGLQRSLAESALEDVFAASRCADETLSKPDPLMLNELLDELGIGPEAALMIGDTVYDMEMAALAGMDGVAMSTGVHDRARLLQCPALDCLETLDQLPDWLAGRCQHSRDTMTYRDSGDRINYD